MRGAEGAIADVSELACVTLVFGLCDFDFTSAAAFGGAATLFTEDFRAFFLGDAFFAGVFEMAGAALSLAALRPAVFSFFAAAAPRPGFKFLLIRSNLPSLAAGETMLAKQLLGKSTNRERVTKAFSGRRAIVTQDRGAGFAPVKAG